MDKKAIVKDEKAVEETKPKSVTLRKRKSEESTEHETGSWSLGF